MGANPLSQRFSIHLSGCYSKHDFLLFIHGRLYLKAVQDEEDFHRRVARALVAVQKRVIVDEGKRER